MKTFLSNSSNNYCDLNFGYTQNQTAQLKNSFGSYTPLSTIDAVAAVETFASMQVMLRIYWVAATHISASKLQLPQRHLWLRLAHNCGNYSLAAPPSGIDIYLVGVYVGV